MPTEHLSQQQIQRYQQRKLSPAELLAVEDHLTVCQACLESISDGGQLEVAFATVREDLQAAGAAPQHLPYERLEAFVDGRMDRTDREIVEMHLELCPRCLSEANDLRSFRSMMAAQPSGSIAPTESMSPWEKFLEFWRPPARWIPAQLAATAILVAVCTWVVTSPLQRHVGELSGRLGELQRRNEDLGKQVAASTDLRQKLVQLGREHERVQKQYDATAKSMVDLQRQLAKAPATGTDGMQTQASRQMSPPRIPITLHDGDRKIVLDTRGQLIGLASLSDADRKMIQEALKTQRIKPVVIAGLTGQGERLLSPSREGTAFDLVSPVGTVVVSERPTFRWHPLKDATGYRISILDEEFNPVANSETLRTIEWTPPVPLKRGSIYTWQVTAKKDGEEVVNPSAPAPPAKFKVLETEKLHDLERAKEKSGGSHLAMGILYARAGLIEEARRELETLVKSNPKSRAARRLLQNLYHR